ncbi:hypothetical protein COO03_04885 [Bacillus sp. AFS098217]|uniref:hypothetical protein n=1 Tax=Bacillus sp. AFS098217 TaxID=2033868 RepID=UPI000BEDA8D5|nr:hypothetical protein [Bacillus sp. AFS098217]PEB54578.1 hypothetical protein COO03_04885 [Bacillus sp. AFS098217]
MSEDLKAKKEFHNSKIKKYKSIQRVYHPTLWALAIIYFIYFMFIDNSLSLYLLLFATIGSILCAIGLFISFKISTHLKEVRNILDIETLEYMQENEFLSPGRKERYIEDFNGSNDGLERTLIYAKFCVEAKERQEEMEEDNMLSQH